MKNSIKNVIATALLGLSMTQPLMAKDVPAFAGNTNVTVLNKIKNIKKLDVSGNVEVYIVQAAEESVKVYNNYYAKNALVQEEDGILRISSFEKEPLKVTVYVRDLNVIQASDNAVVKTSGRISFLSLDVILKDKASADIYANTISLNTSVKDQASLNLQGNTEDYTASLGSLGKINMNSFSAKSSYVSSAPQLAARKLALTAF